MTDTAKTQAETATPRTSFVVPAENIEALKGRIDKLNRRVAMLTKRGYQGLEPISIEVGKPYPVKQKCRASSCYQGKVFGATCTECNGTGHGPDRIFHKVELLAPKAPKVDGWEFVAALTHVEGVGTVLRAVPGANVAEGELARFRSASSDNCDHCKQSRRRLDTFILRRVS